MAGSLSAVQDRETGGPAHYARGEERDLAGPACSLALGSSYSAQFRGRWIVGVHCVARDEVAFVPSTPYSSTHPRRDGHSSYFSAARRCGLLWSLCPKWRGD